jgi:putative NIF3 family GTP cyclohydrolase 1 type 2
MSGYGGVTRRQAGVALVAASALVSRPSFAATQTAGSIVERLKQARGGAWKEGGLDGFVAGDPQTAVRGIAVTAWPSLDSLRKAVDLGCNMVVSAESPFYARPLGKVESGSPAQAVAAQLRADPTWTGKQAFIAEHGLCLYRLSDNLVSPKDDLLADGIADALGWRRYDRAGDPRRFDIPRSTLGRVAKQVKRRLGVNGGMRMIGDAGLPISRVLVVPGRIDPVAVVKQLPEVDLLIAGDLREWELVEYFHDSQETAQPKALIAVGRILSEQAATVAIASWIRSIAGMPVRPIMVEDPYWRLPA